MINKPKYLVIGWTFLLITTFSKAMEPVLRNRKHNKNDSSTILHLPAKRGSSEMVKYPVDKKKVNERTKQYLRWLLNR